MKNILGGVAIAFAAVASAYVNHPFISPLVFTMGICLVIHFKLGLATKTMPMTGNIFRTLGVYCGNAFGVFIIVLLLRVYSTVGVVPEIATYNNEDLTALFAQAALGGMVIGTVCTVNSVYSKVQVPTIFLLMFVFVYMKMPHCVVYLVHIFYNNIFDIRTFLMILLGNCIGGYLIYLTRYYIEVVNGCKEPVTNG